MHSHWLRRMSSLHLQVTYKHNYFGERFHEFPTSLTNLELLDDGAFGSVIGERMYLYNASDVTYH